jgi:CheY-like chemotaxis protein
MEWRVQPDTGAPSLAAPTWLRLKAAEIVRLTAETRHPAMRRQLEMLAAKYLARARELEQAEDRTNTPDADRRRHAAPPEDGRGAPAGRPASDRPLDLVDALAREFHGGGARRDGRQPTILLVEDDPLVRPVMLHTLLAAGYRVDAAANAADARERLGSRSYDLVVTDGRLPDGSGLSIADEAKERGAKALVVTGHALRFVNADLGRHDYLLKPLRPAELISAVRQYVS